MPVKKQELNPREAAEQMADKLDSIYTEPVTVNLASVDNHLAKNATISLGNKNVLDLIGKIVMVQTAMGMKAGWRTLDPMRVPGIVTAISGTWEVNEASITAFIPEDPGFLFLSHVKSKRPGDEVTNPPYYELI